MRVHRAAILGCLVVAAARVAPAQVLTRPELHWETVRTAHFDVHFPRAMRPWALDAAGRLEAARRAVVALVGSAPAHRVTVVIDDPYNVSNGAALPVLDAPTMVFWPTPPDPDDELGQLRDWTEMLVVHEFTHIAHLTRPSRNRFQRVLWRVLPVDLGPIARRAPRWVMEGYATYAEGLLTGSGRPNGAARAGVLRQFALEGRLPTYGQLDGSAGYLGGAMAYLAGSAFLEWLAARSGEGSLRVLWRRMTARRDRDFVAAFTGTFGDSPMALYGRFTAELTGKALRAAEVIRAAGLDTGATFQHLPWYTGDPAASRDGRFIAVPVRSPGRPTRIVVWRTTRENLDSLRAVERGRLLADDPEDVPGVDAFPPPRRPVATLDAARGAGYDEPRFFADGERLLVVHDEPLGDGAVRPDLYEWRLHGGRVRRITHGAAVRAADPAPDGRSALGVRCRDGVCDVVRVDLTDGRVRVVLAGSPGREYHGPRLAPDGRSAVVAVHDGDRWRLATFPIDSGPAPEDAAHALRVLPATDSASRYAPSYLPGGSAVVAVSEAGGLQHLEVVDLATGAGRPLAATTGGAIAPATSPMDSTVYFLSLSARGRDLHAVAMSAARGDSGPALPADLAPAAVPVSSVHSDPFPPEPVPAPHGYGLGPRDYRYLPGGAIAADGRYATLLVGSSDPAGRLDWMVEGALGDRGAWRGGAASLAWRGLPPVVGLSAFAVAQSPSRQSAGAFAPDSLDATDRGVSLSAGLTRHAAGVTSTTRLGASAARLALAGGPAAGRTLAFGSYDAHADLSRGALTLIASLGALGTVGRTEGTDWRRLLARASVGVGAGGSVARYTLTYGQVGHGAPAFEQMVAGGGPPPLTDTALFSQRVPVLALPLGVVSGSQLLAQRLEDDAGPLVLYFDRLSAPGGERGLHDVYGGELRGTLPPVPFLALPAIEATAGAGYSLSAPFKYKLRGYLAVRYSP